MSGSKLAKTTLLVFDADRDTDRLGAAGYKFQYIPYVAVPGADGHPTDSAEARAKGSESWRELIAKLESDIKRLDAEIRELKAARADPLVLTSLASE